MNDEPIIAYLPGGIHADPEHALKEAIHHHADKNSKVGKADAGGKSTVHVGHISSRTYSGGYAHAIGKLASQTAALGSYLGHAIKHAAHAEKASAEAHADTAAGYGYAHLSHTNAASRHRYTAHFYKIAGNHEKAAHHETIAVQHDKIAGG